MKALWRNLFLFVLCTLGVLTGFSHVLAVPEEKDEKQVEKIDDWQFAGQVPLSEGRGGNRYAASTLASSAGVMSSVAAAPVLGRSLGLAVGGAKDTGNFLQNIEQGYLPKYDAMTYEGLFYEYYFDTGLGTAQCKTLFCPSFTKAVTSDLYSGEPAYYLSIGLNSGLIATDFQRKKLNLVVVLDISGSMGSRFDRYYYDGTGRKASAESKNKMQVANASIVAMLEQLKDEDRLGVVLFDDQAYLAKPFRLVQYTDMKAIAGHVLDIKERGGTNWQAGYDKAINLYARLGSELADPRQYENRILFLTDAMPNTGELRKEGLFGKVRDAAAKGIYTSVIGVGIDFNPELVEHVTKTRGANYFSVHSADEFKKRLADEFDFMVTPLVFDVKLQITSEAYAIEGVYGSPEANLATNEVMHINTLFPSATEEEAVKGGVVLVKLKKKRQSPAPVDLTLHYQDRQGKTYQVNDQVSLGEVHHFDNQGIRKAVLLAEYVSLLKHWLLDTRKGCNDRVTAPIPFPLMQYGLVNPKTRSEYPHLSTWERRSCPLEVSAGYRHFLTQFQHHFQKEMTIIGDQSLTKENKVLTILTQKKDESRPDTEPLDDWQRPDQR